MMKDLDIIEGTICSALSFLPHVIQYYVRLDGKSEALRYLLEATQKLNEAREAMKAAREAAGNEVI